MSDSSDLKESLVTRYYADKTPAGLPADVKEKTIAEYRKRITAIYEKHNKEKVQEVTPSMTTGDTPRTRNRFLF